MALDAWQRWRRSLGSSTAPLASAEAVLCAFAGLPLSTHDAPVPGSETETVHSLRCGEGPTHLLLLHGFGAGAPFWFRCFAPFAAAGFTVHALDWRGCGLSGRSSSFAPRTHSEAVAFFEQGIEAWRRHQGVERFVLCGHSMGGQLAAHYALRHPEMVERLVLVSPAGLAERPEGHQPRYANVSRALAWAWELGLTPHSLVRALGPLGPSLSSAYTRRRFRTADSQQEPGLTVDEKEALAQYIQLNLSSSKGGEWGVEQNGTFPPDRPGRAPTRQNASASSSVVS